MKSKVLGNIVNMFKYVVLNADIQGGPYILENYFNDNGVTKEIICQKIF